MHMQEKKKVISKRIQMNWNTGIICIQKEYQTFYFTLFSDVHMHRSVQILEILR